VKTYIFEGIQQYGTPLNWGKFMVAIPDVEWFRESQVDESGRYPLLERIGWTQAHIWVMDLQTGEGAWFRHGGNARADLEKHRIWVCPLFEEFLGWLYAQDLNRLHQQPGVIELPDAQFSINGYRRPGPHDVSFTLRKGDLIEIVWAGEPRPVVCDGFDEHGEAVIRSLTEEEMAAVGKHTELGIEQQLEPQETRPMTDEELERALADSAPAEHPYPVSPFSSWSEADRGARMLRLPSRLPELEDTQEIGGADAPTQAIAAPDDTTA
jgi:hypothetical protein